MRWLGWYRWETPHTGWFLGSDPNALQVHSENTSRVLAKIFCILKVVLQVVQWYPINAINRTSNHSQSFIYLQVSQSWRNFICLVLLRICFALFDGCIIMQHVAVMAEMIMPITLLENVSICRNCVYLIFRSITSPYSLPWFEETEVSDEYQRSWGIQYILNHTWFPVHQRSVLAVPSIPQRAPSQSAFPGWKAERTWTKVTIFCCSFVVVLVVPTFYLFFEMIAWLSDCRDSLSWGSSVRLPRVPLRVSHGLLSQP